MRARYYDPVTGEFISRDPAAPSTREPYAYVGDSPQNSSDPSGLYDCGWAVWNCIHPENLINGNNSDFVNNFQNGGYIAVGAPLVAAAAIAVVGIAAEVGVVAAGSAAIRMAGSAIGTAGTALTGLYLRSANAVNPLMDSEGPVFGRRGAGLLNRNDYCRLGWGWDGTKKVGREVFRLAVGNEDAPIHWHWNIWDPWK